MPALHCQLFSLNQTRGEQPTHPTLSWRACTVRAGHTAELVDCAGCMLALTPPSEWGHTTHTNLDGNTDILERFPQVLLLHTTGDVAEVEGGGGRVDVLVVLAARLLEPVETTVGVVLGETSIRLSILWQLKQYVNKITRLLITRSPEHWCVCCASP